MINMMKKQTENLLKLYTVQHKMWIYHEMESNIANTWRQKNHNDLAEWEKMIMYSTTIRVQNQVCLN